MRYQHILVLTGAGISAESGIPVFRSEDGLWENHRVEDVATPEGFERNPQLVHDFYNQMRQSVKSKQPNAAHLALTKLQAQMKQRQGRVTIVTQNIDDLHEKAQSHKVIHMHGELNSILCTYCGKSYEWHEDCDGATECKFCGHKTMRPDIVWFGEIPYHMDAIERAIMQCDLFIAIGTSGVVYPAAGFVSYCSRQGKPCLEFNLTPSANSGVFTHSYLGKAGTTLPAFVDYFLEHDALPAPSAL